MADASNHFYYYIYNLQGDVIALADGDTGKLVAKYTYDAWGKCVSIENATGFTVGNDNPFRFKGYYYDSETGLYYLNSRYYSPETGRFVNADSFLTTDIADALSANMFAYCKNNPVNLYDDTGLFCLPAAIVGGVLNVGLTIAGAYIDAYINGEPVNGKDLAIDVIFSFGFGFFEAGFLSARAKNVVNSVSMLWSFCTTISRGGSLEEAAINTAISIASSRTSSHFDSHFKKTTTDRVANEIISCFIDGEYNALKHAGEIIYTTTFKPQKVKSSSREIHIHAFGAW